MNEYENVLKFLDRCAAICQERAEYFNRIDIKAKHIKRKREIEEARRVLRALYYDYESYNQGSNYFQLSEVYNNPRP